MDLRDEENPFQSPDQNHHYNHHFSGGSNLRPPHPLQPPTSSPAASPSVKYGECLKNHAATIGGHVVDGCGEFMPKGEEGTPEALKCAACECHRNFHRKENGQRRDTMPMPMPPPQDPQPPPHLQQHRSLTHGTMMGFGGGRSGAPVESSNEDLTMFQFTVGGNKTIANPETSSRKRFRTKFSEEQKEKMLEFAEKLEWKMQKQDEQQVQQFCDEVGVRRKVFKVWLHNNKQTMKKKQI